MNTARRILSSIGSGLVDFTGLFLGYPEQDGEPRRSVREAVLYLSLLAGTVALFICASQGR